jgi:hypothetical protein
MHSDYFPLEPGLSCEYRVEIQLPDTTVQGGMVLAVEPGRVRIGEREYVKSTETPVGFDQAEIITHHARCAPDGVYEIHPDHEDPEEYRLMPLPLVDGTQWSVESPVGDALSGTASFIGEVEVLGKKYPDCVELVFKGRRALGTRVVEAKVTEVRTPSIGMVRATTETAGFTIELKLEAFSRRSEADS